MDLGGFVPGEEPDDLGSDAEDDFGALRGWIAPEDRLWRHPSEMRASSQPEGGSLAAVEQASVATRSLERRRAVRTGAVGAAAMVAALFAGFILAHVPGGPGSVAKHTVAATETSLVAPSAGVESLTSDTTALLPGVDVATMVNRIRPSLVELVSARADRVLGTGVVVGNGSLVVTAASAVAGVTKAFAVNLKGQRLRTRLLGLDLHSGVAVFGVEKVRSLQPASFSDEPVEPGELAVATCLCAGSVGPQSKPFPQVALSTVKDEGSAVTYGQGLSLVDTIEAQAPLSPSPAGGVLLDGHGRVIGILEELKDPDSDRIGVFVPTQLALGVANQLASAGQVTHGWLGVSATSLPGKCGAEIVSVLASMPAAEAGLTSGEVIDSVDGHQVCSLADLQARLYVTPPGQQVQIHLETPSGGRTVSVPLAAAA